MAARFKENLDGQDDEDNRIISLVNDDEHIITDRAGAAGHSDSGYGYMIAADNWQPEATWRVWRFGEERQGDDRVADPVGGAGDPRVALQRAPRGAGGEPVGARQRHD